MRACGIRRVVLTLSLWGIFLTVAYILFISPKHHRNQTPTIDLVVQNLQYQKTKEECLHPNLPVFDETFPMVTPEYVKCSDKEDWVYVQNGSFRISNTSVKSLGPITCKYIPILRNEDDKEIEDGGETSIQDGDKIKHDAFRVKCKDGKGASYENIHSAVSHKEDVSLRGGEIPKTGLGLNILMFGFDSVSRLLFIRSLPKTYDYLTKVLKGVVLERYNILGDGTPEALLPILTGKTEIELPEARRGHAGAKRVDGHPWIWKKFSQAGYVTQWGEDAAGVGTFTYRMLGFKKPPVDYYMRPFYLAVNKFHKLLLPKCVGSIPRHVNMLNWIKSLYHMYPNKRKFSFLFHSEYTHGPNPVKLGGADLDVKHFLEYMEENHYLNNTLLILMADHGPRYGGKRETVRGKYEERLPFFSLRFPPWFEKKYPVAMANLRTNVYRLTSPFDIHETLKDVLNFTGSGQGQLSDRGISLLKEIPVKRTCAHVEIAPHFCACLQWETVNKSKKKVKGAAEALVNAINGFTSTERDLCQTLTVSQISSAVRYTPNQGFLKFKKSRDVDGRVADLSGTTSTEVILYQITIVTTPGSAIYEATVTYEVKSSNFKVNRKEISRINKYGNQPHCVMDRLPHLRPYCYCKIQES